MHRKGYHQRKHYRHSSKGQVFRAGRGHSKNARNTFDFPKTPSTNQYHVTVIVPSTTGINKPITHEKFSNRISQTKDFLSKKFGGSTKVSGQGSYKLGKRIIKEPIAKVETFASKRNYLRSDQDLKEWVKKKRRTWKQESIGVGFESPEVPAEEFHFVK